MFSSTFWIPTPGVMFTAKDYHHNKQLFLSCIPFVERAVRPLKYCDTSFYGCFDIGSREYFGSLITVLSPHALELMLVIRGNSFPSEQHRASLK